MEPDVGADVGEERADEGELAIEDLEVAFDEKLDGPLYPAPDDDVDPAEAEDIPAGDPGASSSGEAIPGPPPLPPPIDAPPPPGPPAGLEDVGEGEAKSIWLDIPGQGRITWYRGSGTFVAKCRNPTHGKCELTRTDSGEPQAKRYGLVGGRPLGFLAAWLRQGAACEDKPAHWMYGTFDNSYAVREECRRALKLSVQGRALLRKERPQADGESEEPENVFAYV